MSERVIWKLRRDGSWGVLHRPSSVPGVAICGTSGLYESDYQKVECVACKATSLLPTRASTSRKEG